MEVLWKHEELTADEIRRKLLPRDPLTDSSVRTLLRRLEAKSYAGHRRDGKRFLFRANLERPHAAAAAVRRIIATICGGTAESLLIGMVDADLLTREELDAARRRIARAAKDRRK